MKFWDISALLPVCLKEHQQDGDLVVWWGTARL